MPFGAPAMPSSGARSNVSLPLGAPRAVIPLALRSTGNGRPAPSTLIFTAMRAVPLSAVAAAALATSSPATSSPPQPARAVAPAPIPAMTQREVMSLRMDAG